jgi:type IV secretory pathway TrbF-like protein
MAAAPKGSPIYTDQLIAWHNQRIWWLALALLGLLAVSVIDNVTYHLRPAPPPYVLAVNDKGDPIGQVLPILSVHAIPDALLRAQLGSFIHDAFTIDRDPDEEKYLFDQTRARVTGPAVQTLDAWYNRDNGKHHPLTSGRYAWAEASVTDTLKLSATDTYQVDYKVTTHENNDQTHSASIWRATLHIIVGRSKDPESLGWFVDEIDHQEVKE